MSAILGSKSLGMAMSTMKSDRNLLFFMRGLKSSAVMMGSRAAVEVMMMSASMSVCWSCEKSTACPWYRVASVCAFSSERLQTMRLPGFCSMKCWSVSSAILPAPSVATVLSSSVAKMFLAKSTATEETESLPCAMPVLLSNHSNVSTHPMNATTKQNAKSSSA